MNKKSALVTLLNKKMLIGFEVMIYSFLKNNSWFNKKDFVIAVLNIDLTDKDMKNIVGSFPQAKFRFVPVKFDNYNTINFKKTHERLHPTFFKLDMFAMSNYKRVVFLDSDIIVLKDIKDLFDASFTGIAGVKGYTERTDSLRTDINSGVLVITEELLNNKTYKGLLNVAKQGHSMPDQKTINIYFRNNMQYMNKAYNVEKRMEHTKKYKNILENKKIVHFIADKPWEDKYPEKGKYPEMEYLWTHTYNEMKEAKNE